MQAVYVNYYEKLDCWYEEVRGKELSFSEAKELADKIKCCDDLKLKENLQEALFRGTIGEVYKFIKKNGLLALCDTGYFEFEDLVNTLAMTWAESLENKISKYARFTTLFNKDYFVTVADRLGISSLHDLFGMKPSKYFDLMATYFRDKNINSGKAVPLPADLNSYFLSSKNCDEYSKYKSFIDNAYSRYSEYEHVLSEHSGACGLMGMAFLFMLVYDGRYGEASYAGFSDEIDARCDIQEEIVGNPNITDIQRKVLELRYGFDDSCVKGYDEIARLLGITQERVAREMSAMLLNLRRDDTVRGYNPNRLKKYCKISEFVIY